MIKNIKLFRIQNQNLNKILIILIQVIKIKLTVFLSYEGTKTIFHSKY